ncbi:HAD family hydrolase [Azohydromonas lata]|uniref:phosphoglycolate phosphatase n=1 Tax=Azohydromonas lata TaxID=45677 RepID=A0ABU5IGL2_9BURK|nr:HAD family hydrolase [Azohydromonas lata]MDZ5458263.1 HAD hydrolase-like protein [Azohydromonas lata]
MRADAIALDLDGTLVDSAPDIAAALAHALRREHLDAGFELRTVRGWVGDGPDALIRRALGARGVSDPHPTLLQRLRRHFDEATLAAPLAHGHAYEGVEATLRQLSRRMPLAVVTNKPTPLARAVLDAAGLLPWCTVVLGADSPEQRKPAPTLLLTAAQWFGVMPSRLLMVGDGPADLGAAAAAGCAAALVAWGYGGVADPGPAVWRLRAPQQLLALLPPQAVSG